MKIFEASIRNESVLIMGLSYKVQLLSLRYGQTLSRREGAKPDLNQKQPLLLLRAIFNAMNMAHIVP